MGNNENCSKSSKIATASRKNEWQAGCFYRKLQGLREQTQCQLLKEFAQPFMVSTMQFIPRKIRAGVAIPPMAASSGNIIWSRLDKKPSHISRFNSKPIIRKKIPSICLSPNGLMTWGKPLPKPKDILVWIKSWYQDENGELAAIIASTAKKNHHSYRWRIQLTNSRILGNMPLRTEFISEWCCNLFPETYLMQNPLCLQHYLARHICFGDNGVAACVCNFG